jgi:hypothetical protein
VLVHKITNYLKKVKKMANGKNNKNIVFVVIAIAAVLILSGVIDLKGIFGGTGNTPIVSPIPGDCSYQPTVAYAVKDVFSSTAVIGTGYYKVDDLAATTTAATNIAKGTTYQYWVSNTTGGWHVKPLTFVANCGANNVIAQAWQNATPSVTAYDLVNRATVTGSAYNTSLVASGSANIEIAYQGVAKKSFMPFGGLMVLEYNATISSVICTGQDITSGQPLHITYSSSALTSTNKVFQIAPSIDDGTGSLRTIQCQFKNGGTANGNAAWYIKFYPADYYPTNAGNFALDVEKTANDDTTRVSGDVVSKTLYFS